MLPVLAAALSWLAGVVPTPVPAPPSPAPPVSPVLAPPLAPGGEPSPEPQPSEGEARTVESTAYCLTGRMANGEHTHVGAVAANDLPIGAHVHANNSPFGAGLFVVKDRIGHGSELDFAMPGDCGGARQWGRREVLVSLP